MASRIKANKPVCTAFIPCKRVSEENGVVSLIGLLQNLNTNRPRAKMEPFDVYYELLGVEGEAQLQMRIETETGHNVLKVDATIDVPDRTRIAKDHFNISTLVIPEPGTYLFGLWCDGEFVAGRKVTVSLMG